MCRLVYLYTGGKVLSLLVPAGYGLNDEIMRIRDTYEVYNILKYNGQQCEGFQRNMGHQIHCSHCAGNWNKWNDNLKQDTRLNDKVI